MLSHDRKLHMARITFSISSLFFFYFNVELLWGWSFLFFIFFSFITFPLCAPSPISITISRVCWGFAGQGSSNGNGCWAEDLSTQITQSLSRGEKFKVVHMLTVQPNFNKRFWPNVNTEKCNVKNQTHSQASQRRVYHVCEASK